MGAIKMDFLLALLFASSFVTYVDCDSQDDIYEDQANNQWFKDGVELTRKNFKLEPNTNPAKNVILFVGDGMGISTTTAARIFDGQNKHQSGEENVLSWEEFPYTALSKTYNTDAQVPDSAGTATAFATGVKCRQGVLGLNEKAVYENCNSSLGNEVLSILTYAELEGMSTGLISTTRITHATPAAFYSHSASRNWENDQAAKLGTCKDISRQLIDYPYGDGLEVALSGGWRSFLPCGSFDFQGDLLDGKTCRNDNKNLTDEWLRKYNNSKFVWNKDQLEKVDVNKVDHLLGLFASSGMEYDAKRDENNTQPDFVAMVKKAIEVLKKNPKGFFLMAEGGLIDWGHHRNHAHLAISEAAVMAKAVTEAKKMTNSDDTLIIVTADHSHGFVLYGAAKRGNPILGFQDRPALDKKPALTLSYMDGPAGLEANESRANLTGVNYNDTDFQQQAMIKQHSEQHGGEDVGIYATGPFAHLFGGVVEQNYMFHVMDYALCLTKSKQDFCIKPKVRGGPDPKADTNAATKQVPLSLCIILATLVFLKQLKVLLF